MAGRVAGEANTLVETLGQIGRGEVKVVAIPMSLPENLAAGMLLVATDLAKSHGRRELFQGVPAGIAAGDRVGLIGHNGAGDRVALIGALSRG